MRLQRVVDRLLASPTYGETMAQLWLDVARYSESDVFLDDPVHVHDLNATILHLLGIDHERLTYRASGRNFRLTDVHGQVVTGVLA